MSVLTSETQESKLRISNGNSFLNSLKIWKQITPLEDEDYPFSSTWRHPEGERDALLEMMGDSGQWQVLVVLLMMLFNIPTIFLVASPEVSAGLTDYYCKNIAPQLTDARWRELSSVMKHNLRGKSVLNPCLINNYTYEKSTYEELKKQKPNGTRPCIAWTYNPNHKTITSQLNVACQAIPVGNMAESVFAFGGAVGGLVIGYLSDRFGRRRLLMVFQLFVVIIGFVIANIQSYKSFLTCRGMLGFSCSAVLLCSSVICVEITGGKWREILSTVYMYSYSLGYILLVAFDKIFKDWKHLQYSITLIAIFLLSIWCNLRDIGGAPHLRPHLLPPWRRLVSVDLCPFFISLCQSGQQLQSLAILNVSHSSEIAAHFTIIYFLHGRLLVPESPRWLLTAQNLSKLMVTLETANSFNRKPLVPGTATVFKQMAPMKVFLKKTSITMMYKTKAIRRLSIIFPCAMFCISFMYYGLALNQDLYHLGLLYAGAIEFVGVTVILCIGFRNDVTTVIISNTLSAISCLIGSGIIRSTGLYFDVICMVARFFSGMVISLVGTIPVTMYPTIIRTMGLGWSMFWTNLAAALSCNLFILEKLGPGAPMMIIGIMGLLGSFTLLFLPGRVARDLCDLVEEVEYGHQQMVLYRKSPVYRQRHPVAPPRWEPEPRESMYARRRPMTTDEPAETEYTIPTTQTPKRTFLKPKKKPSNRSILES